MYDFSQVITSQSDEILQVVKLLKSSEIMLCLWQKEEETGGKRIVCTGQVSKVNSAADQIFIDASFEGFTFKQPPSLYVFIDGVKLLCKLNIREVGERQLNVYFPSKVGKVFTPDDQELFKDKLTEMSDFEIISESLERIADSGEGKRDTPFTFDDLDKNLRELSQVGPLLDAERAVSPSHDSVMESDSDMGDELMYSLDELLGEADQTDDGQEHEGEIEVDDEEKYKGMRTAPRAAPKNFKTITLAKENGVAEKEYVLYDLSQGGMAFNTWIAAEFKKDDIIIASKVGEKSLSPKMRGIVRSVRKVAEGSEEVKVGIQFI